MGLFLFRSQAEHLSTFSLSLAFFIPSLDRGESMRETGKMSILLVSMATRLGRGRLPALWRVGGKRIGRMKTLWIKLGTPMYLGVLIFMSSRINNIHIAHIGQFISTTHGPLHLCTIICKLSMHFIATVGDQRHLTDI